MSEGAMMNEYDVAIIGAGWAGLTLARQLKRANASIRIIQLDASTEYSAKIGEATVEITGHYFLKKMGLPNYLYRRQLPKNGLRFFYDSEDMDLDLPTMSEHGTTSIPPHPAFQIDRARFEEDLTAMNRDDGIEVLRGARVTTFEINEDDSHSIQYKYMNEDKSLKCRWMIDASGRNGVVTRRMKTHYRENVPMHSSAWARFSNVKDFDAMGEQGWRDRAYGRFLSTNHFSGEGYWIWFIPLSGGYTSVGVVCDKTRVDSPPMNQEDFLAFINQHKSIADLLADAEIEDFEAWGQLAYRGSQYVSEQRWGATGFAAFFLDPLLSGGGDIIAILNDNLTKLITADLAEMDRDKANEMLAMNAPKANQIGLDYYQFLYAQIMNLYPILNSGELCSNVIAYTTAIYFVQTAWDYMAGNFEDYDYWASTMYLRRGYFALEKMMQRQILDTSRVMREEGRYWERNSEGFFDTGSELYKYFVFNMGETNKEGWRIDLRVKLFTDAFLQVTGSKLGIRKFACRKVVQDNFLLPQILEKPLFGRDDLAELLARMGQSLTKSLQMETEHTVLVEVTEESFMTDQVNVTLVGDNIDDKVRMRLEAKARMLWNQDQEYIAQPVMSPVFLKFARMQEENIMSPEFPMIEEM